MTDLFQEHKKYMKRININMTEIYQKSKIQNYDNIMIKILQGYYKNITRIRQEYDRSLLPCKVDLGATLHSNFGKRSSEHMTTAGRFPPLDFHLTGHDARGFSYTYNEKKYFRDFQRRVSYREHFKKRVVSLKGLRGFRCSEGSEKEGRSRGGGFGPARSRTRPGPVFLLHNC